MPYPMIDKHSKEEWEKGIEENVGLPIDLIQYLLPRHLSFYLKHQNNLKIKRNNSGEIEYIIKDFDMILEHYSDNKKPGLKGIRDITFKRLKLNEDEFEHFLDKIDYRET